ncbi:MAG: hypothetical protein LC790_03035 [Actinobacteria bacterium]|nr:hypothetical protein [Actinomycetota bacterium]
MPVDHADRVYLIERHVESQAELHGVVDAYAQHSEAAGVPAILATLRTAGELAGGGASPACAVRLGRWPTTRRAGWTSRSC